MVPGLLLMHRRATKRPVVSASPSSARSNTTTALLGLQRTAGNRALLTLLQRSVAPLQRLVVDGHNVDIDSLDLATARTVLARVERGEIAATVQEQEQLRARVASLQAPAPVGIPQPPHQVAGPPSPVVGGPPPPPAVVGGLAPGRQAGPSPHQISAVTEHAEKTATAMGLRRLHAQQAADAAIAAGGNLGTMKSFAEKELFKRTLATTLERAKSVDALRQSIVSGYLLSSPGARTAIDNDKAIVAWIRTRVAALSVEGAAQGHAWGRASAGGRIVLNGTQDVLADPVLIEESARALGEAGSFVTVRSAGAGPNGLHRVQLTWRSGAVPSRTSEDPTMATLGRLYDPDWPLREALALGDRFFTIRDCRLTAASVMGQHGERIEGVATHREEGEPFTPSVAAGALKKGGVDETAGNRGLFAFFHTSLQDFVAELEKVTVPERLRDRVGTLTQNSQALQEAYSVLTDPVRAMTGADKVAGGEKLEALVWDSYRVIQTSTWLRERFEGRYGINTAAAPQVGEIISMVNEPAERRREADSGGRDLWNFHWAGVIMRDGPEYLTLQAVADGDKSRVTTDWYFKLYGSGAESFHDVEKADPHVGSLPITLVFGTLDRPPPGPGLGQIHLPPALVQ